MEIIFKGFDNIICVKFHCFTNEKEYVFLIREGIYVYRIEMRGVAISPICPFHKKVKL